MAKNLTRLARKEKQLAAVELKAKSTAAHYQTGPSNMSLKGKILIAHPSSRDGIFTKSVVYLYQNDENGSIGLVLNKVTNWTLANVMKNRDYLYSGSEVIYKGGPVNESAMVMLHTDDWYSSNTMPVSDGLAISSDQFMLQKIAMQNTPTHWKMYTGMAGWAPRQLEAELKRKHGWLVAELPYPEFVFEKTGESLWMKAIDLCGQQTISNYF